MADAPSFYAMQTAPPALEKLDDGRAVVRGMKVFRTGRFKNSKGIAKTWKAADLDAMVTNFTDLREKGAFVDVPVRADHNGSINSVVGYIENIKRDGDFLVADIEFTEPDAAAKYDRRTYRARSLEVAGYETNDESLHWPVVQGLAFVDIGAVEGLHRKQEMIDPEGDTPVPEERQTFKIKGVQTDDYASVQAHIDGLEAEVAKPPAEVEPHTFRVFGADTADTAAVQAHIDELEGGLHSMDMANREEFVKALAKDGKVLAPNVDEMAEYAKGLTGEQYDAWSKQWEFVPGSALFENHGPSGESDAPKTGGGLTEKDIAQQTVDAYRRAGRPDEWIATTEAGKKLASLSK